MVMFVHNIERIKGTAYKIGDGLAVSVNKP